MIFRETTLVGALMVEAEKVEDERGYFARTFCHEEFAKRGLQATVAEVASSFNRRRGTLRGMHYQEDPFAQAKLVRCTRGSVYDVIIDLRPDSDTYRSWFAADLSAGSLRALYIPPGFAHGFQTLEDDTEVLYHLSVPRNAASERGVRWDDPALTIKWPLPVSCLSVRDGSYPSLGARSSAKK